jgi:uncharacterized protein YeaO (DUF488 family)
VTAPADEGTKSGAAARGARLAAGIVARALRHGGLEAADEGGVSVLAAGGRTVARVAATGGHVVVEVDSRAGAGDGVRLRRLGVPHPDRRLAEQGWRRAEVRNAADASRVVQALRPPREGGGAPRGAGRGTVAFGAEALDVGGVRVRRLLDPASPADGERVFVDAAWPQGVDRARGAVSLWMPEAAPSPRVREAFGPAPARIAAFRRAYLSELRGSAKAEAVSRLRRLARAGTLTLITAVREVRVSPAVVLARAVASHRTPTV